MVTTDAGQVVSNGSVWVPSTQVGNWYPYAVNFKRSNTDRWRAARGKVQAAIQNARIVCVGNSITAGFDSTGVGVTNPSALAYPTQMAQIMNARGLTASWQSWIGGQNITNFNTQDNRIVMGSWTNSGLGTFGANCLTLSTTGQTLMSFTPLTQVDTVEVIALRNNASVAITIAVDGGATLFTYNPGSGSPVIGTSGAHTLGTLGIHAIQANISVATATFLDGMIAWNSAIKEVSVLRAGWQGATTSSFNTSPWFYLDGLKAVVPDLTLIASTRNDVTNATNILAYKASYQPIINAALISGDVILVIEPMGSLTQDQYLPFVQAVYDLATLNNLPLIDFTQAWDIYNNITGWYADTIHPNGFAYGEMGRAIAEILMYL
jgi:lysophospholipase L1-like esterase